MRHTFISLFISTFFFGAIFIDLHAQDQPQVQEESTEMAQEPVLTDQPLQIWTFVDDYRIITGRTLHLTVQIMWKLGVTVDIGDIDKINLHPFRIEGVTIGERQIFDNDHDYIVITYTLSLPPDIKEGIYSIPSFSLSYKNEVDKTEGKAVSSPVAIKKVPILVEGKVNKDVITLGDRINYSLTIRHEKNVRLLWENIEKISFTPFEVLKKDIEKKTEGDIEKVLINYTLSIYELGGKKKTPEIPGLTIIYYVGSPHSKETKTDTPVIETKEVKTAPIPIVLNSLLKAVDVPLEGIKGPMYYSKKDIFLKGHLMIGIGIVLLFFLGVSTVRSAVGKLTTVSQKPVSETPSIALERLKNTISSFQFTSEDALNRKNIYSIDKSLRTYLGTLIGISNETAQSATTTSLLSYEALKKLSEETSVSVQTVLKQLDAIIFGKHINKEMVDKMLLEIEEVIKQTSAKFK